MNIDKAIEIKEAYHKRLSLHMLAMERRADKLSIEALKRISLIRQNKPHSAYIELLGETKD